MAGRKLVEALTWLGQNDYAAEVNDAFPGRDRPPSIAPITADVEPTIVKLRAPAGTTAYSYCGEENKIGKDGHVMVEEHVADNHFGVPHNGTRL
jgi:hypothetical protein